MSAKLASAAALAVSESAASTQLGPVVVPDSQASPDGTDSVQRAKR